MALGADRNGVRRMVVRQGMLPVLAGIGVGLAAGAGLTNFMATLLFAVEPRDVPTFAVAAVVLVGVGALACYVPACRATRVRPIVALRHD